MSNSNNPLFNDPIDKYIFTGSQFRGDTNTNASLRLSKNNTTIDICTNGIDISATVVRINRNEVITSSDDTIARFGELTVVRSTTLYNLSAGPTDISSTLRVKGIATFDSSVTIVGNLTVQGTTTTINSSTVDISDRSITLAAGNTLGREGAIGSGFDICGTRASFSYDFSASLQNREIFISNIGLGVSGDILPLTNNSVVPVSYNSFRYINAVNLGIDGLGRTQNIWELASNYTISITPLSYKSCIKIEFRVNYLASPEADQYLGFKIRRNTSGTNGIDNSATIFVDRYVGSKMGITARGVYTASYIDDLSFGLINQPITTGSITYSLYYRRYLVAYDNRNTIDTSFGILGGSLDLVGMSESSFPNETNVSMGNYMLLQELYRPF